LAITRRLSSRKPRVSSSAGSVASAHEIAVALQEGQVIGQCRAHRTRQVGWNAREGAARVADGVGQPAAAATQSLRDTRGSVKPGSDAVQIARAASLQPQPRQCPQHVRDGVQGLAEIRSEPWVVNKDLNAIEPLVDRRRIAERAGKPFCQEP
jgi:hypothetical protein